MASLTLKRVMAAGVAAIVVGAAGFGYVNAQGGGSEGNQPGGGQRQGISREGMQQRHEQYLNTLAGKLGVTVEKLKQAITDTHNELGGPRGPGGPGGPGGGPGGPGGGPRGVGMGLDAAAQAMNITFDQLRQELAGKTLAEVAAAHNVDASAVANALKAAATGRIDQAVAADRMTADQANQAKQNLDQRINDLMSRTFPAAGQGRGPGHQHGRGFKERGPQQGPQGQQGRQGQQPQSAPLSFTL
jgi:hypothetical protein